MAPLHAEQGPPAAASAPFDEALEHGTAPSRVSRAARFAGLAVIGLTLLIALALFLLIAGEEPRPFWDRRSISLFGIEVFYDPSGPTLWLVLTATVVACGAAAAVVLHDLHVARRHRRTSPHTASRPLAPRRVMAETRGRFAGEVTITALIPAHDEEERLPAALASLTRQTTPPDRTIVVADDCTDGTVRIARDAGVEVVETVDNADKKAGGLNQILARLLPGMGENDAVLVMDADTQFADERFLETARRRMTDDRALMAVGGQFLGEPGHGLVGQFQRNEFARYSREIRRRRGRVFVLTGTASVFRAPAMRAVAAARGTLLPGHAGEVYDTVALTEDNEITLAVKSLGGLTVSPRECTVITELMPTWRALWRQRLRWQRGALENLGQYGVTATTLRYWAQQVGIGYSVIALSTYFLLIITMLLAISHWVWFTFWVVIGLVFMIERVVTAWSGGWRARALAVLVIPELLYDLYCNVIFVKGVADMTFSREARWVHVAPESEGPRTDGRSRR